jgi:hypothetical protein
MAETPSGWRLIETRFRAIGEVGTRRLRAERRSESAPELAYRLTTRLAAAVRTPGYPDDAVNALALAVSDVARSLDYVSRWVITGIPRERFKSEAASAAVAAGLGTAAGDEAVDCWLDLLASTENRLDDLIEASAVMCLVLSAQAYTEGTAPLAVGGIESAPAVVAESLPNAAANRAAVRRCIREKADAKGWSATRLAHMAGVEKSVVIDFQNGKTKTLQSQSRKRIAAALAIALDQFPD